MQAPGQGTTSDWLLWQLADSAFPTGGFAHSGGLEAAFQHRALRGRAELGEYLRAALNQLAHASLPFVHAAFAETSEYAAIDWACDAFLANHVANRASRLQGQAFLSTVDRAFGASAVREFRAGVQRANLPSHAAPVFGTVARLLALPSQSAARLFVFTQLRGWLSAAVRLNVVGPLEAQALQHELGVDAERTAQQFGSIAIDDCAQTAPLLDLWQGTQDRLYSRLFQT